MPAMAGKTLPHHHWLMLTTGLIYPRRTDIMATGANLAFVGPKHGRPFAGMHSVTLSAKLFGVWVMNMVTFNSVHGMARNTETIGWLANPNLTLLIKQMTTFAFSF